MNNALARSLTIGLCGLAAVVHAGASPLGEPFPIRGPEPMPRPAQELRPQMPVVTQGQPAVAVANVQLGPREFQLSPSDGSFRAVLMRWSSEAGWTFEADHWLINREIPVSGSAKLGTEYRQAVKDLLRSTLMSDVRAKPCFYSNQVLRVVPVTTRCDATKE